MVKSWDRGGEQRLLCPQRVSVQTAVCNACCLICQSTKQLTFSLVVAQTQQSRVGQTQKQSSMVNTPKQAANTPQSSPSVHNIQQQ